jgi:WS/DGAT/MGAT family acyltransferase
MEIDRLSADDRLMLDASRRWPQDIGALVLLDGAPLFEVDGGFRIDAVRQLVASRLHLVPRLRQVIRVPKSGRGGPYWADARSFDLAAHVRELHLEHPAGEPELLAAVEQLRGARLDARRPLWQIWFITGLPERRVAAFVKIHHALADGLAAMTIVSTFLDKEPDVRLVPPRAWRPHRPRRPSALVADNLRRRLAATWRLAAAVARPWRPVRQLLAVGPALRELLGEEPGASTSIDRIVGHARSIVLVRADYRTVRRIGRACDATPNDVLLALTAAGMRALLIARGESVAGVVLRAYVPVTLRKSLHGPQQGTRVAQMAVPLPLDDRAPAMRLRRVASETRRRKARTRPDLGKLFRGRLATKLLLKLVVAQHVNITTASIPGPRRTAYLAGARVLEVFPVLPLLGNQPIGIGVVSYASGFSIGITADRDAFPDLDIVADAVRDELRALAKATGAARTEGRLAASALGGAQQ